LEEVELLLCERIGKEWLQTNVDGREGGGLNLLTSFGPIPTALDTGMIFLSEVFGALRDNRAHRWERGILASTGAITIAIAITL
jgi:hypothetical protein